MKKYVCIFFLIISIKGFSREPNDSVYKHPRVLCSFFVNTAVGVTRYPHPYQEYPFGNKRYDRKYLMPVDFRFYFLRNHLGIGFTHFTSLSTGPGAPQYQSYNPGVMD